MVDLTLSVPVPSFIQDLLRTTGLSTVFESWISSLHWNPIHLAIEAILIFVILYILLWKRPAKKKNKLETLPQKVIDDLIKEFQPEPLCPPLTERDESILNYPIIEQKPGKITRIRGEKQDILNFATNDFLGLAGRKELEDAANAALDKYGCGSCGPRGFYGSIDVHVYLEHDLAKFYGTEEAIVYSDAASTVTSAIAAFANRSDLLIVDAGCSDPILTGVVLSRSRTIFVKHNDLEDLEKNLKMIADEDRRYRRKPQRRFVVVEALYRNYGDIAPLDEIIELVKKYKWRLFLDETYSVGVFGATGKGLTEHFGVPISDVDILCSALSTTLASVGGYCVGTREVVDHQRLFGAGYCYSASSPPFVSTVASASLKILSSEGAKLSRTLRENAQHMHNAITKASSELVVVSIPSSPLVHIRVAPKYQKASEPSEYTETTRFEEEKLLHAIEKECRQMGFLIVVSNYILPESTSPVASVPTPPPSIRLSVTAAHTNEEMDKLAKALATVAKKVLK